MNVQAVGPNVVVRMERVVKTVGKAGIIQKPAMAEANGNVSTKIKRGEVVSVGPLVSTDCSSNVVVGATIGFDSFTVVECGSDANGDSYAIVPSRGIYFVENVTTNPSEDVAEGAVSKPGLLRG